jgi:hypothetical protein
MVTLAELFSASLKDRGPRFVELWVSALADLEPEVLDAACKRAMQIYKFFPMPAEIRAAIEQPEAKGLQLEMEEEWHSALRWVQRYYHPDIGISRHAPELSPQTVHALRAAGGFDWIASCPDAELQWVKKRFLADYQLISEAGRVEHLLSDGRAKEILSRLQSSARSALPERIGPLEGNRTSLSVANPALKAIAR